MKIKDLPIELYTRLCDEVPDRGKNFDNYKVEFEPTGQDETGAIEVSISDYESGMATLTTISSEEPTWELAHKLVSVPKKDDNLVYKVIDSKHNREHYPDQIGEILDNPPGDAEVKKIVDLRAKKANNDLKKLLQEAYEDSKNGYVQHVEKTDSGYTISDWYGDDTVASFENGRTLKNDTGIEIEASSNKQATGEADQDYDKEFFDKIVEQLEEANFSGVTHKEFDKYQGVYLNVPRIGKFWIADTFFTGKKSKEDRNKPYKDAYLEGPDGDTYSATSGDYFNMKPSDVFEDYILHLTLKNGDEKNIENPKKSDLPDLLEVGKTFTYEKGTETMHVVFTPDAGNVDATDDQIEIEVTDKDGVVDASQLIEYLNLGSDYKAGESNMIMDDESETDSYETDERYIQPKEASKIAAGDAEETTLDIGLPVEMYLKKKRPEEFDVSVAFDAASGDVKGAKAQALDELKRALKDKAKEVQITNIKFLEFDSHNITHAVAQFKVTVSGPFKLIKILNGYKEKYGSNKTAKYDDGSEDFYSDDAERQLDELIDEPSEGDFVLSDTGPLGSKVSVGIVNGDFFGEFEDEDEALLAIHEHLEGSNFNPSIWRESDHGNIHLIGSNKTADAKATWTALPDDAKLQYLEDIGVKNLDKAKAGWDQLPEITRNKLEEKLQTGPSDTTNGQAIWDALPEADRKTQLKEVGVLKPETAKKEWLELPPITRTKLEEKFKTKPQKLEVGKRYEIKRPDGFHEFNLTDIQGNLATLMDDAEKKFTVPLATLESGLTKGQVKEALFDRNTKEFCPNCKLPLENIGKDGAIQLRDCPNCSSRNASIYPFHDDETYGGLVYELPFNAETIEELISIDDEKLQEFLYSELGHEDSVETENGAGFPGDDIISFLPKIERTSPMDEHGASKQAKWNISLPLNFLGDLHQQEENISDVDAVEAAHQVAGVLIEWKERIIKEFPEIREKDLDDFISDFDMVEDVEGFDYTFNNLADYADHFGILLNQAPSSLQANKKQSESEVSMCHCGHVKGDHDSDGKCEGCACPNFVNATTGKEFKASKKVALELWKHPKDYAGETYEDYYVGPGQHRDSELLDRVNFTSALEMLGGEHEPDVIVARASHWGVGWVESILVHKDSDKVAKLEEIENLLEEYPVLDDDLYSEMQYKEEEENYESWAKDDSIKILELEEQEGNYINPSGLIISEDELHQVVVDFLLDGYSTSDSKELIHRFEEVAKPKEQREKKELEDAGQQKLPLEGKKAGFDYELHNWNTQDAYNLYTAFMDYLTETSPDDYNKKSLQEWYSQILKTKDKEDRQTLKAAWSQELTEYKKVSSNKQAEKLSITWKVYNDLKNKYTTNHMSFSSKEEMDKFMSDLEKDNLVSEIKQAANYKLVYGTQDEKWHKVGPEDRDYIHGLTQEEFDSLGEEKAKERYLSPRVIASKKESSKTAATNHMRFCTTCGKKAGVMSDKAWKEKLDMCSGCYKDYERNEKPRKKPETSEDIIETEVAGSKQAERKEWGVRWTEADRQGNMRHKEKIFESAHQLEKFVEKLQDKDGFIEFTSWLNPPGTKIDASKKEAKSSVDEHAARELYLYITNDGDLYKQMTEPIQKMLMKKIKKGIFDYDRSVKAWMNLADHAAHRYIAEFGSPGDNIQNTFSKATRWETAKELAQEFKSMFDSGELDYLLPHTPDPNSLEPKKFLDASLTDNSNYFKDPEVAKDHEEGHMISDLCAIENEELTVEGLIEKMHQWDESEHGVNSYIYDETKKDLESQGAEMPKSIRRIEGWKKQSKQMWLVYIGEDKHSAWEDMSGASNQVKVLKEHGYKDASMTPEEVYDGIDDGHYFASKKQSNNCFCGEPPAESMQDEEHPVCEDHLRDVEKAKDDLLKDWPKDASKRQALSIDEKKNITSEIEALIYERAVDGVIDNNEYLDILDHVSKMNEITEDQAQTLGWRVVKKYKIHVKKDASTKTAELEDDEEERKEALAKFLDLSVEDVNHTDSDYFDAAGGEYLVLTPEEAESRAFNRVKEDLQDDASMFNQDWLQRFVYVGETDKRMIAGEEATSRVDDMSDEDVIREANLQDDEEFMAADEAGDEDKMHEMINDAKDKIESDLSDRIEEELEDPIEYFVNDLGLYSIEDLMKQSFISIEYNEAAEDAINQDGIGHFLSGYDGEENEEEINGVTYNIYRTN